jgi:hypothetical protein
MPAGRQHWPSPDVGPVKASWCLGAYLVIEANQVTACIESIVGAFCEQAVGELLALLNVADVSAVEGDALGEVAK